MNVYVLWTSICCLKKGRSWVDNFPPPGLWHRAASPRMCLCSPPDSSCWDWLIEMVAGYIFLQGWILIINLTCAGSAYFLNEWNIRPNIELFSSVLTRLSSCLPMCVPNPWKLRVQKFLHFRTAQLLQCCIIRHPQNWNLKTNKFNREREWGNSCKREALRTMKCHILLVRKHKNLLGITRVQKGMA